MTTYRATAERADGWWAVSVPELPGVYTQGRTWAQAQEMARDAIATLLDVPAAKVAVELMPKLPGKAEIVLGYLTAAREQRVQAAETEIVALQEAAMTLKSSGVSVRDAGAILGVSYQRVSQLTSGCSKVVSCFH